MSTPRLTEQQEEFCLYYVGEAHRNATRAAEMAGYAGADRAGWKLMQKPQVVECIERLSEQRNKRLGVSRDYVLAELMEQLAVLKAQAKPKRNSKTGKPLSDEEGNPVYIRNEAGITKVLELIGKMVGVDAFNNKMDVNVTRDDELIEAIRKGREQANDGSL